MIVQLEGELVGVVDGRALVRVGPVTYELLVPSHQTQDLHGRVGQTVRFHTLHYLEGQGQGSSYLPRLIGFATQEDKAFFELFTTVKGIGNRKALRAMALPVPLIANAIANRDTATLTSLPEIGKRMAETIVAELHGKVERFAALADAAAANGKPGAPVGSRLTHDALAVLLQLGEPRHLAVQWIDRALSEDPDIDQVEALVGAAFRIKAG